MQIPTTTTPPLLLDPAIAPDDVRVDSGQTAIQVVPRVHLRIKTPTAEGVYVYWWWRVWIVIGERACLFDL